MTNSNSPYQIPQDNGQNAHPAFTPVPENFQTPPPYQNSTSPYAGNGNPYADATPYQNSQRQDQYSLPPELNPRDKEEYFRMWRGFSYIPRPAIVWWGGLLAAVSICSVVSWNGILYDLFNSVFSTAWIVFGIVGTISFKQGVKQIFVFYPHLATSEKKMIEMRKIARLRVGYTYKDTFSHMWKSMASLLTGIFSSSSPATSSPNHNNANYTPTPQQAPNPPASAPYNPNPYGVPSPYGNPSTDTATSAQPATEHSTEGSNVNLNKENN